MALTGQFQADFTSFYDACTKAEAHLTDFSAGADRASERLNRMVDNFQGKKVIQEATLMAEAVDRIGGAAKLTETQLAGVAKTVEEASAKLRAMGQEVPANFTKITAAMEATHTKWSSFVAEFNIEEALSHPLGTAKDAMVAFADTLGPAAVAAAAVASAIVAAGVAIFELTSRAAAVGEKLDDMAEKTGLSVPMVSKLSLAARVAGSDIETLSSALFMFEKNMGEGLPKFQKGLERIGLTMTEVKAAGVDHWLELVAAHMKETEDPAQRAAAAVELFNRQGRDIIPTLMKLSDGLQLVSDITPWTADQAKAAEHFEMQMKSLKVHAEAFGTAIGRDLIDPISTFVSGLGAATKAVTSYLDLSGGVLGMLRTMAAGWAVVNAAIDTYRGKISDLPAAPKAPPQPTLPGGDTKAFDSGTWKPGGLDAAQLLEIEHAERDINKDLLEQEKARRALAAAEAAFDAIAMATFEKQIGNMRMLETARAKNFGTAEQIAMLYQLDAAEETLTRSVYGQITSEKDRMKLIEEFGKRHLEILDQIIAKELQRASFTNAAVQAELAAQVSLNAEYGRAADGQLKVASAAETLRLGMAALRLTKAEGISQAKEEQVLIDAYTKALYSEALAQDAETAATAAAAQGLRDKQAALDAATKSTKAFADGINLLAIGMRDYKQKGQDGWFGWSPTGAGNAFINPTQPTFPTTAPPGSGTWTPPTRDTGGPVAAGSSYLIGRGAQPELFTPGANGFMTPNGGGTTITVHQSISGVIDPAAREQLRALVKQAFEDVAASSGRRRA